MEISLDLNTMWRAQTKLIRKQSGPSNKNTLALFNLKLLKSQLRTNLYKAEIILFKLTKASNSILKANLACQSFLIVSQKVTVGLNAT